MRQGLDRIIAIEWGLLGLGLVVQLLGGEFWAAVVIGGAVICAAATLLAWWSWRIGRMAHISQQERQRRQATMRMAMVAAGGGLLVAVVPRQFWVQLGGYLAVLGGVMLILTYLVRSMFPAPKKS